MKWVERNMGTLSFVFMSVCACAQAHVDMPRSAHREDNCGF